MKMPHGKYKGHDIESLPTFYLLWVAENWRETTQKDKEICEAADQEWQFREKHGCHID